MQKSHWLSGKLRCARVPTNEQPFGNSKIFTRQKEQAFNDRLQNHFDTVKQANGQPLNDKRNGRATLNKWDRQSDALRNLESSIQRTKDAIEREEMKIALVESVDIPDFMLQAINDGRITQWRKHPRFFFVTGVKHGRIVLDEKRE